MSDEPRVGLSGLGAHELARALGFDTYEDFCWWRDEKPDEYERWYQDLKQRVSETGGDEPYEGRVAP